MDSKTTEEVRKRRAKPSPPPLNIFQKMLLLGGVLTAFLVIGMADRVASILWAMVIGVIGVSLLVFFWFKSNRQKKEIRRKADLGEEETLPLPEEAAVRQETPEGEEDEAGNMQNIFLEEKKGIDFEEKPSEELEEVITLERFPEEKRETASPDDFPSQEKAFDLAKTVLILEERVEDIQKLLSNLEDRVVHVESALLKLEEKAEEKVDLQLILSQLGERDQKTV